MSRNMYIWFGEANLAGTATADEVKGKKAIELLSFSHGVHLPLSGSGPSGQSRQQGKTSHSDFTFTKYVDKTTPHFNAYCSGGNSLKKPVNIAVFHAYEADEKNAPVKFLEYELTDCIVTSVSIGAGGGDLPIETITLNYTTIKWTYNQIKNDTGSAATGDVSTTWNLLKNTP